MKVALVSIALALILMGMWVVGNSFSEPGPTSGQLGAIQTAQRQEASPIALGMATLVGGVLLLVMVARR